MKCPAGLSSGDGMRWIKFDLSHRAAHPLMAMVGEPGVGAMTGIQLLRASSDRVEVIAKKLRRDATSKAMEISQYGQCDARRRLVRFLTELQNLYFQMRSKDFAGIELLM